MTTMLAVLAQESGIAENAEPYDTIGAVTLGLLLLVYVTGLPATVVVAAAHWRQRTRRPPVPARAVPGPGRPAAPPAGPMPPPVAGRAAGEAFLHLQRLERQVLALRADPAPVPEFTRLAAETAELAGRHGADTTVGRHAAGLQAIVAALAPPDAALPATEPPVPPAVPPPQLPDRLRVGLARLAAAGRPVPAQWAFAWCGHRADRWPAAADRRRDELAHAFTRRYHESFPYGGMILVLPAARLVLHYTPASARFGGHTIEVATGLPDVTELPDPARRLHAVVAVALADLHPPVTQ